MYKKIGVKRDRKEGTVEIGIISNPDEENIPQILDFIKHKGEIFIW